MGEREIHLPLAWSFLGLSAETANTTGLCGGGGGSVPPIVMDFMTFTMRGWLETHQTHYTHQPPCDDAELASYDHLTF